MAGGPLAVKDRLSAAWLCAYAPVMTDRRTHPQTDARAARLAEQLRANLRKRKAQARAAAKPQSRPD